MLVDHLEAGCWLLPGGHVDDGEDPRTTVVREAQEELGIDVHFHERLGDHSAGSDGSAWTSRSAGQLITSIRTWRGS